VPPVIVDPNAIETFATASAFERWLKRHHADRSEVFIRMYKKASGIRSIDPSDAIDIALCWGWIDAIRKSYDEHSFLQRFTPRRPKSLWSQINRERIERLVTAGKMTPHGLAQVEAAKADGRWDAAYASSKNMQVPDDLLAAIRANTRAQRTFDQLNKQNRFALAFRLGNLRTVAGRERKIEEFVQMLAEGRLLHPMALKSKK
jgi:uncharacterized protein YdeI (YjbR/CyaY-like superfamily)